VIEIIFLLGLLVALSMIILYYKLVQHKWASLTVDAFITFFLLLLFAGSFVGLSVATVAGILLSIYFYFKDPSEIFNFDKKEKEDNFLDEIEKELK